MSVQLKTIIAVLNEHSVPYWVNFGTLLGLMREGKPLEHDKDIDIGIWAKDKERMKSIIPSMKKSAYRIIIRSYRGMNFHYKFVPRKDSEFRTLDINMFRQAGEFAWSPQPRPIPIPNTQKTVHSQLFRIARGVFWRIFSNYYSFIPHPSSTTWPFCRFIEIATWWEPAHYFNNLIWFEEWECFIPKKWQQYLTFKYGHWNIPVKEWHYWDNAGGLVKKDPFYLIKEMEQQKSKTD